MHYVIGAIIAIILSSIFFLIAKKKARKIEKEMDANDFIIRQPKASRKLYIFVTVFFFLIFGFSLLGLADGGDLKERWWVFLVSMSPFMALGPFLLVLWHRYKIEVKGNQITACSYFGKEKTFTFDYVTKVNIGVNSTKMGRIEYIIAYHEKEKLFSVSAICPGYQVLVSRLNNRNESVN
jgi:hypothetical protein